MSGYMKLTDIVMDALPEENPWMGNVKGLVEKLVANGVTIRGTEDTPVAYKLSPTAWIPVTERLPQNFVSVLGYMTDAGDFPPVRECYTVGNAFFFPALQEA